MSAERPILVANLTDAARDYLEGIALAGRAVVVPVERPPADDSMHELEVHTPSAKEPLRLLARRAGPATSAGVPLVLQLPTAAAMPPPPPSGRAKSTMAFGALPEAPRRAPPAPSSSQSITMQAPPEDDDAPQLEVLAEEGGEDRLVGRDLAAGKLHIEALVGQGGAGSVYRARHRDLHMSVAVKVMHESFQRDAEFCKRFHTEALSASRLDQANLTRVLDFGQEPDGLLYIAMEFLDGQSVRDILDAQKRLPVARVANILIQVCSGLLHAHARNIVHRDIKPENVVIVRGLDDNGKETEIVKVCDFGIAHRDSDEAQLAGTAEYMAPELYRGERPDVQSDVYACGVMMYELLTGLMPIPGDFAQVAQRIQIVEPEPPSRHAPGLDARVDRVVMKAIAKQKQLRYPTIKDLREALRAMMEEISLFSSGGYWNEIEAAPVSIRSAPPAPEPADGGGPDWLERGPGYLHSMVPSQQGSPPPSSPMPPSSQRAPLSGSLMPSMRAPAQSYSSLAPSSQRPMPSSSSSMPAARATGSPSSANMPAQRASIAGMPAVRPPAGSQSEIMVGSSMAGMAPTPLYDPSDESKQMAQFLQRLMQTTDADKFGAAVPQIDAKVRTLMADKQTPLLWRLRSTLDIIASEKTARAAHAQALVKTMCDRDLLAPIADRALDGLADRDGTARKMIVRAGRNGAYALYGARLKDAGFEARERFVAILQEAGASSLHMIRAGLERLESRLGHTGATPLAEDLLKALPPVTDDATGELVARYTQSTVGALALVATNALPKISGVRARPLLIALVDNKDDPVSIAAIKGLRDLDQIDAGVIRVFEPLILGELTARMPPRIAAVEALAKPTTSAIGGARQLLTRALQQTTGTSPDAEDLIVCTATSLLAIGGDATLVAERWRKSTTWLRTRLEAVLRQYQQTAR